MRLLLCALAVLTYGAIARASDLEILRPYLAPEDVRRYALVVSVENYTPDLGHVDNARNDALAVGEALHQAHFEVEWLPEPETPLDILTAIRQIVIRANPKEAPAILAVFFAGHGFQHKGYNYIVPRRAQAATLLQDSLDVSNILLEVSPQVAGLSVIFLDSCRAQRNLLGGDHLGFANSDSVQNVILGLAADHDKPAASSFVLESVASKNSPYSTALSKYIAQKEPTTLSLAEMWDSVRHDVRDMTGHMQDPREIVGAMQSRFWLMENSTRDADEASAWQRLLSEESPRSGCIRKFIDWFPGGHFNKAALVLLDYTVRARGEQKCGG